MEIYVERRVGKPELQPCLLACLTPRHRAHIGISVAVTPRL
jgi:hypothetical protein